MKSVSDFIQKHFCLDLPVHKEFVKVADSKNYFHSFCFDCCPCGDTVYVGINSKKISCPKLRCSARRYHSCIYPNCNSKPYELSCLSHPQKRRNIASINYRSIKLLITELVQLNSFRTAINYTDITMNRNKNNDSHKDIDSVYTNDDDTTFARNMKEMKGEFQKFHENFIPHDGINKNNVVMINLVISYFYDSFQFYHRKTSIFAPLIFTIKNLPPSVRNKLGFGTFLLSLITYASGSGVEKFILFDCFIAELLSFQEGVSIVIESNGIKTLYRVQMRIGTHILDMPALCKLFNLESCFSSTHGCPFCNWGKGYYDPLIRKCKYFNTGRCLGMRSYFNLFGTTQQCMPNNWCTKEIVLTDKQKLLNNQLIELQTVAIVEQPKKKSRKLFLVEKVLNHVGMKYDDLTFDIKWEKSEILSVEKWALNETIRDNYVVLEYIKSVKQLKSFYNEHILGIKEEVSSRLVNERKKNVSLGYHKDQIYVDGLTLDIDITKESKVAGAERQKKLKTFLNAKASAGTAPSLFLNSDILDLDDVEYNKLSDDIYSIYCDFRKCDHFKYLTTEKMKFRAISAVILNERNYTKTRISFEGTKDWCMFLILSYILGKDLGFEPAHVLFNICKQILDLWKGSPNHRQNLPGVKAYCKEHGVHPCIWDSNYKKEWEFSKTSQTRVHGFLKCLIIPKGSGDVMKIVEGLIFQKTGNIKGMGKITIMKSLMDLILFSNTSMRPSYKGLFRIFSNILRRVLSKYPPQKDLDVLFWRSVEFISAFEKLIPVTEMTMNIHAISCVMKYIKSQISIYECWACPGESAHWTFKKLGKTAGGIRPELSVWKKYSEIENARIIKNYRELDMMMMQTMKNTSSIVNLSFDKEKKKFIYDDETIRLRHIYSVRLSDFEFDKIIEKIYNEIIIMSASSIKRKKNNSYPKSSAYRVIRLLLNQKSPDESIFQCLVRILDPIQNLSKLKEQMLLNHNFIAKQFNICIDNAKNIQIILNKYDSTSILDLIEIIETQLLPLLNGCKVEAKAYDIKLNKDIQIIKDFIIPNSSDIDLKNIVQIFEMDIQTLYALYKLKGKFFISNNIDFGGKLIHGRGFVCSEKSYISVNATHPANKLNRLYYYWNKESHRNSWIRLKPLKKKSENARPELPIYAHLNYSFTFSSETNVISCPYLNKDIYISSCTAYRTKIQHRENIIITDSQGNNSIKNMYPNQLDETDPFHNSRIPYLDLSENSMFHPILPYFVNSRSIFQTSVTTIAFCRFQNRKENKIIKYKAIDIVSKSEETPSLYKNDVINLLNPLCRPHILAFLDVSPEVTVDPESHIIKQEIKDMHKIWINDQVIYDSGSELSNNEENVEMDCSSETSGEDIEDIELISHDSSRTSDDCKNIEKIDIEDDEVENIPDKYYGFRWENNSCAFDSIFTILFYAFCEMNQIQKQQFSTRLGRFGELFLEMFNNFNQSLSHNPFIDHKQELLGICYKLDHLNNCPYSGSMGSALYSAKKYNLPSAITNINNKNPVKSLIEFNKGKFNKNEFNQFVMHTYFFNTKFGKFTSPVEITLNLLRINNEINNCLNSSGNEAVLSILFQQFHCCNNQNCLHCGEAFNYIDELPVLGTNEICSSTLIAYTTYTNTNSLLNAFYNGIISEAYHYQCIYCKTNTIVHKRKIVSFPLLINIDIDRKEYHIDKTIKIILIDKSVVNYILVGIIYGDGAHFTSSIFMNNDMSNPFYYDGNSNDSILQQVNVKRSFNTDLANRKMLHAIYRKVL